MLAFGRKMCVLIVILVRTLVEVGAWEIHCYAQRKEKRRERNSAKWETKKRNKHQCTGTHTKQHSILYIKHSLSSILSFYICITFCFPLPLYTHFIYTHARIAPIVSSLSPTYPLPHALKTGVKNSSCPITTHTLSSFSPLLHLHHALQQPLRRHISWLVD